ncbi:hypothetical protein VTK26DRAFT_5074 [Humicola hyalothermophila]
MGGGGPAGNFSTVGAGETGETGLLAMLMLLWSLLRSRPNQPLDRFDLRESATLLPPRLGGRFPSWPAPSPACPGFRRVRLNRRRMLDGRLDTVGDAGPSSSARLLLPVTEPFDKSDSGDAASGLSLAASAPSGCCPFSVCGVSGGVGAASSCTGDGRGGGMSVPSVREPKENSSAGSSKRLFLPVFVAMVVIVAVCDDISRQRWR